ncbi:MAG: chemotaxis protein CheW [Gammaproteobacteria bacterium]|nr:chemotaxis protein CheW [Gammaproteobacteria bacterium]
MSSEAEELYSLLIPLTEDRLIVPRACVAEVVRFSSPEKEAGAHDWMLGSVTWNGRPLPVISFEGALGRDVPAITGRTRIVVFYASTGQLKTGHFGVLTQGFPQLVRVNKDVLQLHTTEGWPQDAPVLCRVKMINEFPLIPNLEKLEAMLARESQQA